MSGDVAAIGADGARGGWVAALARGGRVELRLCAAFAELPAEGCVVAVDVPIGLLPAMGPRGCDVAARKLLGARASTVFAPPSRPLLAAATYAEARALTGPGPGISAQAFALAPKIREADAFMRAHTEAPVFECHPELSFRQLAGGDAPADKRSAAGVAQRVRLLERRFPDVLDALSVFGAGRREAEVFDALDALAALHTALRVRDGEAVTLGGDELDAHGLPMRIVY